MKTLIALAFILLTSCASPSMRELAESDPNEAKVASKENTVKHYGKQPKDQLRMYIYTEFDKKNRNRNGRDGYFIDLKK